MANVKLVTLERRVARLQKATKQAFSKLQASRRRAGWSFCPYQGCNECYSNNGLIAPERLAVNGWDTEEGRHLNNG